MSTNPLNDISKVYLEQVVESSHLETDMEKRAKENEKARQEITKTKAHKDMAAAARKKFDEGVDQDKDGDTDFADIMIARMKASGKKTTKQAIAATKNKSYNKEAKVYDPMEDPDFDHDEAEENRGVSGKNNPKGGKSLSKKKVAKEGYSNWRQDLSEIIDSEIANKEIKEKKVNNKVKTSAINGGIKLGEAVEEMGGTLLEMVEIDEFDFILESAYDELLDEGYDEDEVEGALEYALTEAKVTMGHDTPTEKKRSGLLAAARQKLSGAKKAAKQAVATGARKVAKGALGVARKMEAGSNKPHTAERRPSTYRGVGAGQKEKVSSGSYTPPTKKKADPVSDPWEGSYKKSSEVKAKTKKASAPKAKAPARKRKSKLDDLLASVRSENIQIDEKTLTKIEMKKREEIVKSMKDKASDFEKRYPGRGKEVMYATATKMAKRMAEDIATGALQLNATPTSSRTSSQSTVQQKNMGQQRDKMRQQEIQILQKKLQALRSAPKGSDPSITAGYEPEGEMIDERRRSEKGTPRKPRDPAFELVAKSMGSSRMGVQPRGKKNVPGQKPPAAGEYGSGVKSPTQKISARRAGAQRAQDMMHSRFD